MLHLVGGYPLIDLHDVKRFGVKSTSTKWMSFDPLLITIPSCRCVLLWANGIGKGIRIVIENVLTKINNQIWVSQGKFLKGKNKRLLGRMDGGVSNCEQEDCNISHELKMPAQTLALSLSLSLSLSLCWIMQPTYSLESWGRRV
jgi:hypothetical protein